MKVSQALLGLTLLAALSATGFARAEDARQPCDVPAYLLNSESVLSKVAEAVKTGKGCGGIDVLNGLPNGGVVTKANASKFKAEWPG